MTFWDFIDHWEGWWKVALLIGWTGLIWAMFG